MWRASLGCPGTLLQGCVNGFKPTEMSYIGIVVIVIGNEDRFIVVQERRQCFYMDTALWNDLQNAIGVKRGWPCPFVEGSVMVWAGISIQVNIWSVCRSKRHIDGCTIYYWDFRCVGSPIRRCYRPRCHFDERQCTFTPGMCYQRKPADSNNGENGLVSKVPRP